MIGVKEILFFAVVFVSNVIQCITGFAGTVLAMPFSIMLVGYDISKPILNVLGIVVSLGVISINRKALNKKEFIRIIAIMLIGMIMGLLITHYFSVSGEILYKILGLVVLVFMLIGCCHTFSKRGKQSEKKEKSNPFLYILLVISGIVHGMFVCGGPLLVIYAGEKLKGRDEFRVTVSAVWVVLNTIILCSDIHKGYFNLKLIIFTAISVVVLFAALWVGNIIFRHINKKTFMILTYILMAISGISLLLK